MRSRILILTLTVLGFTGAATAKEISKKMPYPKTRREQIKEVIHGVSVEDPYRWLEDAGSPEVKTWMAAQDRLTRDALEKMAGRDALTSRLKALYYVDSISAPWHRGQRFFYTRTHADREKAIVYYRDGETGPERVLLDPNTMSKDGTVSLGVWVPNYQGTQVAYAIRANNSDEATLQLIDVATGKVSSVDLIEGAKYAQPSWTPSGDGFYYTFLPAVSNGSKGHPPITVADRPGHAEIRFHKIGTDPKSDLLIHARTSDPETFIGASISRDGRWLFTSVQHGWNATDVYYRDLHDKTVDWKPFVVGEKAQFNVFAWKDHFYIHTNFEAPRWRMLRADVKHLDRASWIEIVPQASEDVLENFELIGGHLELLYLRNAASEIQIHSLDGKLVRNVPLPGLGASSGIRGEADDTEGYFDFTSFTQARQIFKIEIPSGETKLWAEVKLPIDASPYTVEQVWYPSKDGTKISMFLVHRKDLVKDGKTPFLLTGYGGFNVSMQPSFSSGLYPWLEAGGGFAVPNLRGGGEYGEAWHQAGMLDKKQNVFDDFIGAAQYLIKEKYTRADRLAIRGGSNGGLLMGAAITQHPELFRAVICAVPLLDMVRFHRFGSGKTWVPEYGTAEDASQFQALFSYSPYHHVKKGTKYPALLMMSADADDRVDPMHARKMVAELQAANASEHPIWLRIEQHSGHGGADLVRQAVAMSADGYTFLMHELGMTR